MQYVLFIARRRKKKREIYTTIMMLIFNIFFSVCVLGRGEDGGVFFIIMRTLSLSLFRC